MDLLLPGDVLVLDRGYFSYLLAVKAMEKNIHLVCRLQMGNVNKAVQAFWDSEKTDEIITYMPSVAVKYESKKYGYDIEPHPIKLRLIKYKIEDETYICATTLFDEKYSVEDLSSVYHGRWGIEELYKISKHLIKVEDFHSKSERGVKQECYAHILLINLARIFEMEANQQQPPSETKLEDDRKSLCQKDSYWQDFCGAIEITKVNFKNCIFVVGRNLEKLLLSTERTFDFLSSILKNISRVRQKIRPGRHFPRQSRKTY